jgi:hypothetical protein
MLLLLSNCRLTTVIIPSAMKAVGPKKWRQPALQVKHLFSLNSCISRANQSYGSGARENQILALLRKRCSIGINAHLLR